jgi:hypothetical protein
MAVPQSYCHAPIVPDIFSGESSLSGARRSRKTRNSNNPLAVEPETENDAARESLSVGSLEISFSRGGNDKD